MEARLVIFLAFTGVTLTANTLFIWFAYKAFASLTTTVTRGLREFQANSDTRAWLQSLETASAQAASMTNFAREQMENLDPVLARAQNAYGFELAKIDARLERACDAVVEQVDKAQQAILHPARKLGMVAADASAAAVTKWFGNPGVRNPGSL